MTRPEALLLCHRTPYPPNKGDKIRSWRLTQRLAERYRLHLACFVDDPDDRRHAPTLREICESVTLVDLAPKRAAAASVCGLVAGAPLSIAYFNDARMRRAVTALRRRPLVAEVAFSSSMAQYLEPLGGGEDRKLIIDFCDADAAKWRDYAARAGFPLKLVFAREGRRLAQLETEIANRADLSLAVSAAEAAVFNDREGIRRPVAWWGNGVDASTFDPAQKFPPLQEAFDLVFVGAMDYRANIDAALWFCREVWPAVRAAKPAARLAIVGANPTRRIRALDRRDGVGVTGRVADVRPWIAQAKGVVAPLQIARGVQNKVLEAMAMARPVIATSAAAVGIQHRPGALAIADEAKQMSALVVRLLSGEAIADGAAARADVLANHSWDAHLARLCDHLAEIGV